MIYSCWMKRMEVMEMKKICLVVMAVLSVLLVSCITFSQKSIWISDNKINLDILKSDQRKIRENSGEIKTWNCYKLSKQDFEKLWNSSPKVTIYRGMEWYPFDPEEDFIESYNASIRKLMLQYDVLCSDLEKHDNGGGYYYFAFVVNRKTGQVRVY